MKVFLKYVKHVNFVGDNNQPVSYLELQVEEVNNILRDNEIGVPTKTLKTQNVEIFKSCKQFGLVGNYVDLGFEEYLYNGKVQTRLVSISEA